MKGWFKNDDYFPLIITYNSVSESLKSISNLGFLVSSFDDDSNKNFIFPINLLYIYKKI